MSSKAAISNFGFTTHILFVGLTLFLTACGGGGSSSGGGTGGPETWPGTYSGDFNVRACDNVGICENVAIPTQVVVYPDHSIQVNPDGTTGVRSVPDVIDPAGNFGYPATEIDFPVEGEGICRLLLTNSGNVDGNTLTMIGAVQIACANGTVAGDYNFSGTKTARAWSQDRVEREREKLGELFR